MLSPESLQIIKSRSQTLKGLQALDESEKEARILEILKSTPEDDDAYYLGYLYGILINIYLKRNNPLKVVKYVNKVILLSGMALYEYCGNNCPFSKEKLQMVLDCYFQAEVTGNYSELWGKGRILQLLSKYTDAKIFYEKLIEHDDKNINTYRMYARLYEEMNDFVKANEYFSKAEELQKDPLTECMMATVAISQYQYEKAESILNKTIEQNPDFSFAKYRLIEVFEKSHQQEKYEQHRKQLLIKYPGNIKYIINTIYNPNEDHLYELKQIKDSLKDGVDYSSVNQVMGRYYYDLSTAEEDFNEKILDKAISFYEAALKNNKYCYLAYIFQIQALMKKSRSLINTENFNETRIKLIKDFHKNISCAVEDYIYFKYADSSLENQIDIYDEYINFYPLKSSLYFTQANNLLVKYHITHSQESKDKLADFCTKTMGKFPNSAAVYFDCYTFFQELELYDTAEKCIKKCIELSEKNFDIQIISQKLNFYREPQAYKKHIKAVEEQFIGKIGYNFYLDLAIFYYNKSYSVPNTKISYSEISLELIEKTLSLEPKLHNSDELNFLYSLLLYSNNKKEKAHSIYSKVKEDKVKLILQIKDCWDILPIDIFFNLYKHKYNDNKIEIIKFWIQILLFLLRYNLFDNQKYTISHYTSIAALSAMLSDKEQGMSAFRLCSLGSANDPKEGKIIYDFLTKEINDMTLCQRLIDVQENNYTALQASFTKLEDALTMFRLYGKKDKNEGTGVNLVFNESFFSEVLTTPLRKNSQDNCLNDNKNNDDVKREKEKEKIIGKPLYWILYWDKNDKMYFNPQGIYKTLEINLLDNQHWNVLNKEQEELKLSPETFYHKYAQNISYVLNKIKEYFVSYYSADTTLRDLDKIKEELLNISYLIKDVAFYDEKELRIIEVESITKDDLKHDDSSFTLYEDYSKLTGLSRYPKTCPLEKIIIGPKVEQKETMREYLLNHLKTAKLDSVRVEFSKAPLA